MLARRVRSLARACVRARDAHTRQRVPLEFAAVLTVIYARYAR